MFGTTGGGNWLGFRFGVSSRYETKGTPSFDTAADAARPASLPVATISVTSGFAVRTGSVGGLLAGAHASARRPAPQAAAVTFMDRRMRNGNDERQKGGYLWIERKRQTRAYRHHQSLANTVVVLQLEWSKRNDYGDDV